MCLQNQISSGFICDADPKQYTVKKAGISEAVLSAVIGQEYASAQELFEDKSSMAEATINNTATRHFARNVYSASSIEDRTVGERKEGFKSGSGVGGFYIELDAAKVPDVAINLNNVSIQIDYTGNLDLKVWNIIERKEIHSQQVAVVAGELVNVPLSVQVKADRRPVKLFIGYSRPAQTYYYAMYGDCVTCPIKKCGLYAYGYGADFNPATFSATRNGHMSGMSVDYSISCLYEKLICANQHQLSLPMLYLTCAELMRYALNSKRWNDTEQEKFQRDLAHYSTNYEMAMDDALKNIRLPNNECFGCSARFGTKTITP